MKTTFILNYCFFDLLFEIRIVLNNNIILNIVLLQIKLTFVQNKRKVNQFRHVKY